MTQLKTTMAGDAQATVYFASNGFSNNEALAKISILLDTNVPLNAYDVEFSYNADKLTIERVDSSDSIITILQRPVGVASGRVSIRGGSSVPFSGSGGKVLTVYVRAKDTGSADLDFTQAKFYQADGKGTLAVSAAQGAVIRADAGNIALVSQIDEEAPAAVPLASGEPVPADTTPPKIIKANVLPNPFDGEVKLFVFSATDGSSSIAMSRVRTRSGFSWDPWEEAVSPHPVAKQAWEVQLEVIDGAGNVASQTLYRAAPIPVAVVIAVLAIALILWIKFSARRRANNDIIDSK